MEKARKTAVLMAIAITVLPVSTVLAGFEAPAEEAYSSGNYGESRSKASATGSSGGSSPVVAAWRQAASDVMSPHETQKQQFVSAEEGDGPPRVVTAEEPHGTGDVLNRVEALRDEMAHLQGQVELMSHAIARLQQQQRQMYDDMNKRMRQAHQGAGATDGDVTGFTEAPAMPLTAAPSVKPVKAGAMDAQQQANLSEKNPLPTNRLTQEEAMHVLQEQRAYKVAYAALRAKHYDDAKTQFQQYLNHYPKGAFAANAYYWLGELYLLSGDETQASEAFDTVVGKYPHSSKAPDALLKKGYMYFSKDQYNEAGKIFAVIQRKYPGTTAAELAKQRSQQLKQLVSH